MAKVLKADASADEAWVELDFGIGIGDFWITTELYFTADALAAWEAGLGNGMLTITYTAAHGTYVDYLYIDATGWRPANLSTIPTPVAGAWVLVEIHYQNGGTNEFYLGGVLQDDAPDPQMLDVQFVKIGLDLSEVGADPHADSQAYFRYVNIGVTRAGSEYFGDDFEDGTLDAWTTTYGAVSVVTDPAPPPLPAPPADTRTSVLRHFQHYEGLDADKFAPGPTSKGMGWWATDTKIMYRSTGSVWEPLGSGGIEEITSEDGTIVVTDPTGPTVDLSAVGKPYVLLSTDDYTDQSTYRIAEWSLADIAPTSTTGRLYNGGLVPTLYTDAGAGGASNSIVGVPTGWYRIEASCRFNPTGDPDPDDYTMLVTGWVGQIDDDWFGEPFGANLYLLQTATRWLQGGETLMVGAVGMVRLWNYDNTASVVRYGLDFRCVHPGAPDGTLEAFIARIEKVA